MARPRALASLGRFCAQAWLGVITAVIWLCILGAALATVGNGSKETGWDILIVVGWTTASMVWGGVVVRAYRREPMRKMAADLRAGQDRIEQLLLAQAPPEPAQLAAVRPIRGQ